MGRVFDLACTVWTGVQRFAEAVIIVLSLVMVASLAVQVVARYVFNAPLTWSEELARYTFIWLSFLGAWLAWSKREHLGIDLLAEASPPRVAWILRRIVEIVVLVFAISAMVFGRRILEVSINQPSAVLRVPMAWVYLAFYAGFTLIAIQTVVDLVGPLIGRGGSAER